MLLNLTPAEAERWAYANGDTQTAALIRRLDQTDEVEQLDRKLVRRDAYIEELEAELYDRDNG